MITPQLVLALNPRHPRPEVAAAKLQAAALHWGITMTRQVAMWLSQLAHESGLIPQEENLSYRASRICQVWRNRFPTLASALPFQFNPQALGDQVYSGRMGNAIGEGFLYRGRGQIQLTGKSNYAFYGQKTGFDLVKVPDLLLQYGVSAEVAGAFWQSHSLNAAAERGDVMAVTRAINGGLTGLSDREALYQRTLNRIPRYGLLDSDAPLNVSRDAEGDLSARYDAYAATLALLA